MKILRNRKRLNNKGFTLIELLAVVVILAVVMGIAMTNVLSAMNKSRGGSLEDSAIRIAQAFNQKYTETLVSGIASDVYGDVTDDFAGYDFTNASKAYYLTKALASELGISEDTYAFADSDASVNADAVDTAVTTPIAGGSEGAGSATIKNSFIDFNVKTTKFVVCMVANPKGSYYVNNYTTSVAKNGASGIQLDSGTYTFNGTSMVACSDGTTTWDALSSGSFGIAKTSD